MELLALNPRDVCSGELRCFGMWLLFYNNIVNPLYCQCLLESENTLINIVFFLGDHVLKDSEP